jgi:hypothetical protein
MQSVGDNACFLTPDVCLDDAEEYIPKIAASKGLDLALVDSSQLLSMAL